MSSGVLILYDDLTDSTVTTSGVEVKAVGRALRGIYFLVCQKYLFHLSHKIINYYLS